MSIEALRKKRHMRRPKPRFTDGQKSAVLLALTFLEGWLAGFATTHSRVPSPVALRSDDNRLAHTGHHPAAHIPRDSFEVGWRWNKVSSRSACRATRCRRGVPASTTGTR